MLVLHKQKQSRCFLNCQASRGVACVDYIQPLEFLQILSTTLTVYSFESVFEPETFQLLCIDSLSYVLILFG